MPATLALCQRGIAFVEGGSFPTIKAGAPTKLEKAADALYVRLEPDIFHTKKEGATQRRGGINNCKLIKKGKDHE